MSYQLAKAILIGLMASNIALAETDSAPDWNAETLTGDWGGTRSALHNKGITVELNHKSDALTNLDGGVARGSAWLMNSAVSITLDMEKLGGWEGVSTLIQYHLQHGDPSINQYTGSFAGVSNIETGNHNGQFFQAWLQKNSADNKFSVLAGLYAVDTEFYVNESAGLFIQPPYGMSAEMANTGKSGPPVFPMGALALRTRYSQDHYYIQGVLTDGVPGNPNNSKGTQILLDQSDGTLAIVEFGYNASGEAKPFNKTAIGLWNYSAHADDLSETDAAGNALQRPDQGYYFLTEHTLFTETIDSSQGLSGFIRYGTTNKDVYQADWSASLGLNYQGLIDGRDDDSAGIAVTTIHASSKYQQLNNSESAETLVEVTYRAQLKPWLALQPTIQRFINPNMDATVADAWVAGIRLEAQL